MNDGGWMYANAKIAAAREIARHPSKGDEICRKYGIIPELMTDDEIEEFEHMIAMERASL